MIEIIAVISALRRENEFVGKKAENETLRERVQCERGSIEFVKVALCIERTASELEDRDKNKNGNKKENFSILLYL